MSKRNKHFRPTPLFLYLSMFPYSSGKIGERQILKLSISDVSSRNGGLGLSDIISQIQASKDASKLSNRSAMMSDGSSSLRSHSTRRSLKRQHERGLLEDITDKREVRRNMNSHVDRQYSDTSYRDTSTRDSHGNHVPHFQRPLLEKNVSGRVSASRRRTFDDSHLPVGETPSYVEGHASLSDALTEGLSPSSDWRARVPAFIYIRSLLQQGPRGFQEVVQSFKKRHRYIDAYHVEHKLRIAEQEFLSKKNIR